MKTVARFLFALAAMCFALMAASQTPPVTVRVGGAPSLMYLPFYVGIEQGFFARQGLAIDLTTMSNPVPALLSGEINLALNGSDSAVVAAARGRPTPALVMMQQRNSMSLTASNGLARAHAGKLYPTTLTDLRGKTIAIIGRGSGAEIFVKQMLDGAQMEEGKDYNIVVIGSPSGLLNALKANQVDAANLWSPFQEQAWVEKIGVPLVREVEEGPPGRRLAAGISVHGNSEFLKARSDVAKRFADAMVEANAFTRNLKDNQARLVEIAMKYTGVSNREVLLAALPTISSLAYPGVDCAAWAETAKGLYSVKSIPHVPKCEEITAADLAPKGPIGPAK